MQSTPPPHTTAHSAVTPSIASPESTGAVVRSTLRPTFLVGADPADLQALDAYARACGADVAAWDLHTGRTFLTEEAARQEGATMAASTLAFGACTTDDRTLFLHRYQAAFHAGYLEYVQAARTDDGVPC